MNILILVVGQCSNAWISEHVYIKAARKHAEKFALVAEEFKEAGRHRTFL